MMYRRCPKYPHPDQYCKTCRNEDFVQVKDYDEEMWCFAHSRIPDDLGTCFAYRGKCDVHLAHLYKGDE